VALVVAARSAAADTAIPWQDLRTRVQDAWPLVIPLIAAAGALRLNNGHGDMFAVLAIICCAAALCWAIAKAEQADVTLLVVILFAVSLAVMWAYSLRGDIVYGFDIATEYHGLHQTVLAGVWHFAHPGDAYGAELAVTILPAELHFLTGASDLMVLKLLYPMIFALFPVAIFGLARRIIRRRWAFIAAVFLVVQSTFAQEFPALARQEIATVFYIQMLAALFDAGLPRRPRWALTGVFGLGMAVSHYSTTYFTIEMLVILIVAQFVVSRFRDVPRLEGAAVVACAVAVIASVAWYGPVTRSGSNVTHVVSQMVSEGFNFLSNQGGSPLSAITGGGAPTPITATQYQSMVAQHYATSEKWVVPLTDAKDPKYALQPSSVPTPAVRVGPVHSLVSLGEQLAEEFSELLGAAGAAFLAMRRKTRPVARQVALLGLGTLICLVLLKFSGTAAEAYNPQRAFVQAYGILAIPMAWSLQYVASRLPSRTGILTGVAATGLMVIFVGMSGLSSVVLGGARATNLSNSGEDADRYVTTVPEIGAGYWLDQWVRPGQLVTTDRYGQLRLAATTTSDYATVNDVTPQTIDGYSWIYATTVNVVDGRARALFNDHTVTYGFPQTFLNSNFDLVYANGSSEVFHR
jgi:hypothetical protein